MYKRILVPIDGSDHASEGLRVACALAEHDQAKLILLCVTKEDIPEDIVGAAINEGIVRPASYREFAGTLDYSSIAPTMMQVKRETFLARVANTIAEKVVERGTAFASDHNVSEVMTLVRSGHPDDRILEVADDHHADLIVIASRGTSGIETLFDPSIAQRVRDKAKCPCLVLYRSL